VSLSAPNDLLSYPRTPLPSRQTLNRLPNRASKIAFTVKPTIFEPRALISF
jgi:hypothetical protein